MLNTRIMLVGNLGRDLPVSQEKAAGPVEAVPAAKAHYGAPFDGEPVNGRAIDAQECGWLSDLRALIGIFEAERWQGLNDGSESRQFVPVGKRLAKHFLDLYDGTVRTNNAAAIALVKSRLERLAVDRTSRRGGLL